ncbi:MAG: type I-E CRISPR-associated protein Cas7/Cse4/CasC [Ignavibacteriaceae bacterium]|nr:type I-E CRISPR-associated protein Cas7/Cse4/CasC [Ignavibacteriaceae bacterium]
MLLELHLIQNFAPSCLNRDDANAPKDCEFGGTRRARISSQCIKRSVREEFKRRIPDQTGSRTKLAVQKLAEKLVELLPAKTADDINKLAKEACEIYFGKTEKNSDKLSVLVFFDDAELAELAGKTAEYASGASANSKKKSATLESVLKDLKSKPVAFDIALFGRMLAEQPGKNIDGACQVAHAISTNRVSMEFDFFTAVDDLQAAEESGAGMMGTVGFNSSCFYRYSVVQVEKLLENLRGDKTLLMEALREYITASFTAVPTGKQNSFAAHNPPSFAFGVVRKNNMPWSLANAFEKPVRAGERMSLTAGSVEALDSYWKTLSRVYRGQAELAAAASFAVTNDLMASGEASAFSEYRQEDLDSFIGRLLSSVEL